MHEIRKFWEISPLPGDFSLQMPEKECCSPEPHITGKEISEFAPEKQTRLAFKRRVAQNSHFHCQEFSSHKDCFLPFPQSHLPKA